ncbi:MAG TPA: UDP-N-acetylglucosamine 2-epimerase, partial [Armatimonadota bacterium]
LLFAPTPTAVENLRREGIPDAQVFLVGDVMYDAALHFAALAERRSDILAQAGLQPRAYVLATVHRAENTDDPARLRAIFTGLDRVAGKLPVVVPLHPRTRAALTHIEGGEALLQRCRIIPPVGYLDMIMLEQGAALIATDSGGVQKEAFFYQVPCVTLRDETEWTELVDCGWNRLAPPDSAKVVEEAIRLSLRTTPGPAPTLYGDGHAGERIIDILCDRVATH